MSNKYTYDENKEIALHELTCKFVPFGARFHHIETDPYELKRNEDTQEYMIVQVLPYTMCLINLNDGNRWSDPVEDTDPNRHRNGLRVQREMLDKIAPTSAHDYFTLRIPDQLTLEQYVESNQPTS